MECKKCGEVCIKKGKHKEVQKYYCTSCSSHQRDSYSKPRITTKIIDFTKKLSNEGVGISSISRLLNISKSSVQRIIEKLVTQSTKIILKEQNQEYELDELRTYVGNKGKQSWVIYAINKSTGKVIDLVVGRRTKENIRKVVNTLLSLNPKRIYTDGLNIYRSLISKNIHRVRARCTNKIERMNLTLRTYIKRLNRKTISFSRSELMLYNTVKLYLM